MIPAEVHDAFEVQIRNALAPNVCQSREVVVVVVVVAFVVAFVVLRVVVRRLVVRRVVRIALRASCFVTSPSGIAKTFLLIRIA